MTNFCLLKDRAYLLLESIKNKIDSNNKFIKEMKEKIIKNKKEGNNNGTNL